MITLITGLPGSCKTLYTIDKLMQAILKTTIKTTNDDGVEVESARTIYTNINGLLLPHEKIDLKQLDDWHKWCKPGDVIIADEVQKQWPLCATGSKVPPCIEGLETHRHMGVDFILMTQHPMMVHANICRLAGRHLHMRRLGNMGFSTVYEWDGVSRTLLYKNCMAKFPYRFNKKVFELYKSAELHTKQARKLPSLIFGLGLALAGAAIGGPMVYDRLQARLNPVPVVQVASPQKNATVTLADPSMVTPEPLQLQTNDKPPPAVMVSGCIATKARCSCFDLSGQIVPTIEAVCRAGSVTAGMYHVATSPISGIE